MLVTLLALLAATVIAVPLSRKLGFGSILGYLVAGVVIGPSGAMVVTNVDEIAHVSELGVIMLLFLIGLELRPMRLWALRNSVLGLGGAQLGLTLVASAILLHALDVEWASAFVLGAGLALSSTAIVLPMLSEHKLLSQPAGRDSFAVLLFQDMAFIPLVAMMPLLAGNAMPTTVPWLEVARALAVIAVILIGGTYAVRPLFKAVGGSPEVTTALALLIVVGTAELAHYAGLSTSLGAFMAGVILSGSEYRHELQADIEPFKGLLLGFFFISVGMSANMGLAVSAPLTVSLLVVALVATKTLIAAGIVAARHRDVKRGLRFGLALSQGSEFSFVLFAAGVSAGALSDAHADLATLVIALSMLSTPILFASSEWLIARFGRPPEEPVYETIENDGAPVIICGFGRVGQIVGRVLFSQKIPFTALEKDQAQVDVVRRFGTKIYYGDPARLDLLRAAGAETAKVLVVALEDMEENLKVAEIAKRHFRNLAIFARARNRRHAHALMDLEINGIIRETFFSSLRLSEIVLQELDLSPQAAKRAVDIFRQHDEQTLIRTHAMAGDEEKLVQDSKQTAQELLALVEADIESEKSGSIYSNRVA